MLHLKMPPMDATTEERKRYEAAFNGRAAYRYGLHTGADADGTTRWQTLFAAGWLRSKDLPESMRNARRGTLGDLVDGKRPASTITVSAADLPLQQRYTAGTSAHSISMSRRNAVEGVNGDLKRNFTNIDRGYVRVFGTERVAFLMAFSLAGLNIALARTFRGC